MTARWEGDPEIEWVPDGRAWTINEKLIALAIAALFVVASVLLIAGAR